MGAKGSKRTYRVRLTVEVDVSASSPEVARHKASQAIRHIITPEIKSVNFRVLNTETRKEEPVDGKRPKRR